jgi:hypothetical protein
MQSFGDRMMTTFTKPVLRELRNQLQTLLDGTKYIGTAQGLNDYTFELGNCSYSGGEATFKLKVLIKGGKSIEEQDLEQMARLDDLDTDKTATIGGKPCKLVGYKAKARKLPWIIENLTDGSRYVIDDYTAKKYYGIVAEVS